jgi:Ferredoxin subunits of nitrite reductase and ring-hydroxylating dioxygenases
MADGWIRAVPLDELQDARPRRIVVDGTEAFVVRNGESLYAIGLRCTHQGAPLDRGVLPSPALRSP